MNSNIYFNFFILIKLISSLIILISSLIILIKMITSLRLRLSDTSEEAVPLESRGFEGTTTCCLMLMTPQELGCPTMMECPVWEASRAPSRAISLTVIEVTVATEVMVVALERREKEMQT